MKQKLYLLAFTFFLLARANAAITVTINAPAQYQLIDTAAYITATVGNIINHNIPYIKAKVLDREISLTWTGQGFSYAGRLSLNGLPAVDTLTITVTAVGFSNDTATGTVTIIHDLRPKITLLYSPSKYIATPNLRVTATCKSYTGAACQLKIIKQTDSAVLATGVDSIDATVNCAPTKKNDTLVIVSTDERNSMAAKQLGYYYETDPHFTPIYVADGPRVGDIVDVNYGKILTFNSWYCQIINLATDSTTLIPSLGTAGIYNYFLLTKAGFVYKGDGPGSLTEYNKGITYQRNADSISVLYQRGDNYLVTGISATSVNVWDIEANTTETIHGSFPYPYYYGQRFRATVSNKKVIALDHVYVAYYYSNQYGVKSLPFQSQGYYRASGNIVFYLTDSSGYYALNVFDGVNYKKIADVGHSPNSGIPAGFQIVAKDGFAAFTVPGGKSYLADSTGNAVAMAGYPEMLGDDGNYVTGGRFFCNKHGDTLLHINNTRGKAYYYNGNWYMAVSNVLYRLTMDKILPTRLTAFTGVNKGNTNQLSWQTAQEVNTAYFELQHATTANRNFSALTTVTAAGNSNTAQNYAYTHTSPAQGTNYYRLKMVDKDGKFTYSRIVSINNGEASFKAAIVPNIINNNIALQINATNAQTVRVDVVSVNGTVLLTKQFAVGGGSTTQTIAVAGLAKGAYFVRVTGGDNKPLSLKVMKE